MSEFSPFGAEMRDMELATTKGRIKAWCHLASHNCPQCGQFQGFPGFETWGQTRRGTENLRSLSRNPYSHNKNTGVNALKG